MKSFAIDFTAYTTDTDAHIVMKPAMRSALTITADPNLTWFDYQGAYMDEARKAAEAYATLAAAYVERHGGTVAPVMMDTINAVAGFFTDISSAVTDYNGMEWEELHTVKAWEVLAIYDSLK